MKGDDRVIDRLNQALKLELGAVNQYWVHYRLTEELGLHEARQEGAGGVDRRDAPRRSSRRAHNLP
jgi:bacterioferritin